LCDAGYFCTSGSNSKTPSMGSNADTCTIGNYCPNGTTTPQQCPPGSYNPSTGRQTESQCLNCTGGYYCGTYGMTSVPNGNRCTAGKLCLLFRALYYQPYHLQYIKNLTLDIKTRAYF
jgi:hypothetical protein